jgi:pimeloyl-ACP methyl ester carboxylesterase
MSDTKHTSRTKDMVTTVFLHGFSGEGDSIRPFADLYSGPESICINMPGFGGTPAPKDDNNQDIRIYCDAVWAEIRKQVPSGQINLVGHSHGTMIGYVLAIQHSTEVRRLDLFCPVARPSFIPRSSVDFVRFLQTIGLSPERIIRIAAHPALVELVTRYTFHPDWSDEERHRITQMRLREAQFYSPIMFDLMRQTLQFKEVMDKSYCSVPTNICYTSDDNVASPLDYEWYEDHTAVKKIKEISGGHLCVVANPQRVVELFGHEEIA